MNANPESSNDRSKKTTEHPKEGHDTKATPTYPRKEREGFPEHDLHDVEHGGEVEPAHLAGRR